MRLRNTLREEQQPGEVKRLSTRRRRNQTGMRRVTASENRTGQTEAPPRKRSGNVVLLDGQRDLTRRRGSPLERGAAEGESPLRNRRKAQADTRVASPGNEA